MSHDYAAAQRINRLLHAYSDMIVGRMGMPYRERGVYIIHTSLDGPRGRIEELSQRLAIIPGVSAKTIYAKEEHELG
ncbi:MAG: iron-only hydrogenase system regulator [Oscillospiraceae bacterium]|nr:iron-only hydrogenase system regulator [Oscillospiraceae bacterium]